MASVRHPPTAAASARSAPFARAAAAEGFAREPRSAESRLRHARLQPCDERLDGERWCAGQAEEQRAVSPAIAAQVDPAPECSNGDGRSDDSRRPCAELLCLGRAEQNLEAVGQGEAVSVGACGQHARDERRTFAQEEADLNSGQGTVAVLPRAEQLARAQHSEHASAGRRPQHDGFGRAARDGVRLEFAHDARLQREDRLASGAECGVGGGTGALDSDHETSDDFAVHGVGQRAPLAFGVQRADGAAVGAKSGGGQIAAARQLGEPLRRLQRRKRRVWRVAACGEPGAECPLRGVVCAARGGSDGVAQEGTNSERESGVVR